MNDFFKELDEEIYRYGGSWAAYLVRALWPHRNGLPRQDALAAVKRDALGRRREIPATFNDVIQSTFQQHNRGSDVFKSDGSQDIFCFVGAKGRGAWGLNRERALAWMTASGRAEDLM